MDHDTFLKMLKDSTLLVERGSVVYGTLTMNSDRDLLAIVPDEYKSITETGANNIVEYQTTSAIDGCTTEDYQFICESDFQKLIDDCTVLAIETICTPMDHVMYANFEKMKVKPPIVGENGFRMFDFDPWKVRQQFSGTASNSWAKAHKKMTVEKDFDLYRGQKSLFHSLRILMFANQICERGYIYDYQEGRDLWYEIYGSSENEPWDFYKEKYRPMYNKLRSRLAILAPKPVDGTKNDD